jgi:hypothetical protein
MTLILTDLEPRGLGYLELDSRACGPLPPGTSRYFEADTYTCTHCTSVVILNPERKRERYKCKGCNHHICDNCAAVMATGAACETFAQKVEQHLEREARHPDSGSIILP